LEKRIKNKICRQRGSRLRLGMLAVLLAAIVLSGCGEKKETVFEMQENVSDASPGTSSGEGSHSDETEAESISEGSNEQEPETDAEAVARCVFKTSEISRRWCTGHGRSMICDTKQSKTTVGSSARQVGDGICGVMTAGYAVCM